MHRLEILLFNRFTLTGYILGLPIASQIAAASLASFLLLLIKGFTNCGGMIFTG